MADNEGGRRMTIGEHLEELRARLVRALLATTVGFGLALWRIQDVITFLQRPLAGVQGKVQIIQTRVYDAFTSSMLVALFAGLVLAGPVILTQIWGFVAAGLYRHERRVVRYYALPGFALFFFGAWLAYALVVPYAAAWLIGWASDLGVVSQLTLSDWVGFVALLMFVFGLMFQMPMIMVFLMRIGVVEPAFFRKYRRHAILVNFVIGTVLTPPDVISQSLLAGCLIVLYEGGILIGSRVARARAQVGR